MNIQSRIEWTDATWNPVTGCRKVSPGCKFCYAERFAERWRGIPGHPYEQGFDLRLWPERLRQPLRWRKPRTIFVNSMSDLFHEDVPDGFVFQVFDVMVQARQHRFQILTKRHQRLASLAAKLPWPPNVWMGVSVESNQWLGRVKALQHTSAAVKFLSCEPLLGPLDLDLTDIDWVIVGGESGPKARPMQEQWALDILYQCRSANVPFFFKQWGEFNWEGVRKGKKHSGRELAGRTWDELPDLRSSVRTPPNSRG